MPNQNQSTESGSKSQRKIKNFLLMPIIQLRIATWSAFSAALFSLGIALVFYYTLRHFSESFADIGSMDDETINRAYQMFEGVRLSALGILLAQVVVSVGVAIVTTHRLVGPTVAFRRQVRAMINGQYDQKVTLRNGDAFTELASDLNELSDQLKREPKGEGRSSTSENRSRVINE